MMGTLFKAEGFGGIYRGLSASLLREMTYSSIRFGMYEPIRDKFQKAGPTDSNAYRIVTRIGSGLTAGGIAAALCSPTDLLKVTVQKNSVIYFESLVAINSTLHRTNLKVRAQGYPTKPPGLVKLFKEVAGQPLRPTTAIPRLYEVLSKKQTF